MAGLVPAIHVLGWIGRKDVDGRYKSGHDDDRVVCRSAYAAFVLLFFEVAVVPITSSASNFAISVALSPSTSPSTS